MMKSGESTRRVVVMVGALGLMSGSLLAEQSQRSVTGQVTGDSGTIIEGAAVQLKNLVTLQVRSYITQSDGLYRFHGLHREIEFEVRASYRGRSSRSRRVSRFDSSAVVQIDLRIPPDKADLPETGRV
jgi:hypothetical protein